LNFGIENSYYYLSKAELAKRKRRHEDYVINLGKIIYSDFSKNKGFDNSINKNEIAEKILDYYRENNLEDEFMKKGIMLIVDGTDPELVRSILEAELVNVDSRHQGNITFWKNIASAGPAWGMIGTLLGLINMLKNLSDPDSIGPNMSVALVTTLYGSIIANWLCAPIVAKLSLQNETEIKLKEVMIEGILSIQAGENPRVIEEKLKSFLAPKDRQEFEEEGGGH
jgi:chemotaxis protein MotA